MVTEMDVSEEEFNALVQVADAVSSPAVPIDEIISDLKEDGIDVDFFTSNIHRMIRGQLKKDSKKMGPS